MLRACRTLVVALLGMLLLPGIASAQAGPRVTVTGGTIEGERSGDALLFRGIPFAAPPLGALRWQPPQPVLAWTGIRPARGRASACPQNDYRWNREDHLASSEDCLTLDIRTESLSGRRPVMVWIHGGSNRAGSAGDTVLSPLTREGVVLVAIQYRLGILGFLSLREAAAEAGGHAGNYGLMDQIAALRWVRDNIARFGGDPGNVTVFGESAGSQDVSLLLAAPQAQGLFGKAIMESGTPGFGLRFRPLTEALAIGDQAEALLEAAGSIAAMRQRSAAELLAADLKLHDGSLPGDDFIWLSTTIDGAVLPETPRALFARTAPKPVIIGTNRVEFAIGPEDADIDSVLARTFGAQAAHVKALYRFDGPERLEQRLGSPVMEISTDRMFRCPAAALATLLAQRGWPVWRYEFDVGQDGGLTSHSAEIAYVMNDRPLGTNVSMMRYWTRFAATGDPNDAGRPEWPRFTSAGARHLLFDARGATPQSRLKAEICASLPGL